LKFSKDNLEEIKKTLSEKEIFSRLYRFCAFQERAVSDVEKQLDRYQIDIELRNKIIEKLKAEGFINEERFAKSYINSKLRSNKWGRIKIIHGLKEKSVDIEIINRAIESIDREEYIKIIDNLIKKKNLSIKEDDLYIKKNKIARFIIYKGFESDIVWDQINISFA
jgi:regulatory protein